MRQFVYNAPLDLLRFFFFQLQSTQVSFPSQNRECALAKYKKVEIIITYNNVVFLETAIGLRQALLRLGLTNTTVAIMVDGYKVVGDKEEFRNPDPCSQLLRLQIALAPHEETMLLGKYIAFHMEQSWSSKSRDIYSSLILSEAVAVWSFSYVVSSFLKQNPFLSQSEVDTIPIYSDESQLVTERFIYQSQGQRTKKYDVSFFGSHSSRRQDFIEELLNSEFKWMDRNRNIRSVNIGGGFYGGINAAMTGEARNKFVAESKVGTSSLVT